MSVPMTLRGVKLFRQISLITLVWFDLERPNLAVRGEERNVYLGDSHAATTRGRGPNAPIFGVPLFMHTPLSKNNQI